MKYTIYADIHCGSPIELMTPEELLAIKPDRNTILLGDIVDGANCETDKVNYYKSLYSSLYDIHGTNYIDGNHERMSQTDEHLIIDDILFAHGDIQADPARWVAYRAKKWGAGWFKRKFVIPFIREAEEIIDRKPKIPFLERAAALAGMADCHTFVCAHFHPKELIDIKYQGVRIVIVPRGKTEIEL